MRAQAMLERGLLESAVLSISHLVTDVGEMVQARPYVTVCLVIVAGVLLLRRW